ncbi:MAG: branched-chain amino acid ABC transporter permease [Gammaproteobacteria bacterium]|nr:branched-chain amino acid ABC transporter permease [Gammaproteobacteria bacterium]
MLLFFEQLLNGLQFGFMLFLLSAGLTLVFGVMNLINLAHGSFYMVGAYVAATVMLASGSFVLALLVALVVAAACGLLVEVMVLRHLYRRDHLDQVLATFGLILFFNEATRMIWGRQPLFMQLPEFLSSTVEVIPDVPYPLYRLVIIGVGLAVALGLYLLINHTRLGMRIRAGASDRSMIAALGVNIRWLYSLVFALGALLAGFAGVMAAPIFAVESGMGESILILTFVVIVIGGIGSIKGALLGALLVGLVDTLGRAFLPDLLQWLFTTSSANSIAASLASMSIYILMAAILAFKPRGLFPV